MARPFSSKAPGSGGFDLPSLSDDEDNSSTATSVRDLDSGLTVLGYVDGPVASPSTLDWKTSRVGGLPVSSDFWKEFSRLATDKEIGRASCRERVS